MSLSVVPITTVIPVNISGLFILLSCLSFWPGLHCGSVDFVGLVILKSSYVLPCVDVVF